MARQVDHAKRRTELAGYAAKLIAGGGPDAATVRAVANAAGHSTMAVSHYFTDKRALLFATYEYSSEVVADYVDAELKERGVSADLYLDLYLPIEPIVEQSWLVWVAFLGYGIADDGFAELQRRGVERILATLKRLIGADPAYAWIDKEQIEDLATAFYTALVGISMQAVFDREAWPSLRQRKSLRSALKMAAEWQRSQTADMQSD